MFNAPLLLRSQRPRRRPGMTTAFICRVSKSKISRKQVLLDGLFFSSARWRFAKRTRCARVSSGVDCVVGSGVNARDDAEFGQLLGSLRCTANSTSAHPRTAGSRGTVPHSFPLGTIPGSYSRYNQMAAADQSPSRGATILENGEVVNPSSSACRYIRRMDTMGTRLSQVLDARPR